MFTTTIKDPFQSNTESMSIITILSSIPALTNLCRRFLGFYEGYRELEPLMNVLNELLSVENNYENPTRTSRYLSYIATTCVALTLPQRQGTACFTIAPRCTELLFRKIQYDINAECAKNAEAEFEEQESKTDDDYIQANGYSGPNF